MASARKKGELVQWVSRGFFLALAAFSVGCGGGAPLTGVQQVSVGGNHTCALLDSGEVQCWGSAADGGYGDSSIEASETPTVITALRGFTDIEGGSQHICGSASDGSVKCWGYSYRSPPVVIRGVSHVAQLSPGFVHSCALTDDGHVWCWGKNDEGQLGDGSNNNSGTQAVEVKGITTATQVSIGFKTSCALLEDSTVQCWGRNAEGTVGDGTTTNRDVPVKVLRNPAI